MLTQSIKEVKKFKRFRSNWSSTCNDSETGSRNCLACRTTDIRYKPRHHEPIEQKTSQVQRENGTAPLERNGSNIQSAFVEVITHQKTSNESFKIGARSQNYGLEPIDILPDKTTVLLNCVKGLLWKLAGKKVVRTVKHSTKVVAS